MRLRLPLVLVAAALVFAGGVLSSGLFLRDARAQTAPFAATLYVPSDGIAFRSFEGRVVARLSYDAHGGVIELYDEHEQPSARWPAPRASTAPAATATATTKAPPFKNPPDYDPGF
jgi:hypothetical protein